MNDLININYEDNNRPTVMGRELHEALEVKTEYKKWFERMTDYGFTENEDFLKVTQKCPTSSTGQNITNHQLTIPMAKEICMLQRSEKGKQFRQYFISIEEKWNSPESVMARALQYANNSILTLKQTNAQLETTIVIQEQQIQELKPKASYYDVVLNCPDLVSTSTIAKDYGKSAKWLNAYLQEHGVQFKQGNIWLLYQKYAQYGYTSTKTHTVSGTDGIQHAKVHTYWTQKGRLFIYDLLKSDNVFPTVEQNVA